MKRLVFGFITALLVVALAFAGCATGLREPEVHLAGIRLGGLGLRGGVLYVRLNVVNPNSFALEALGLTYDVELSDPAAEQDGGWVDLAEGRFEETVRVAARDSSVVEIPVEFTYAGASAALRSLLDKGTFDYRVRGEISVSKPVRTAVPYRHSGTVALGRAD
ncbi:MAG TPA: LEA type 2 family protein [Longimicrobiales bacterium]